jgi:hypothetical protein
MGTRSHTYIYEDGEPLLCMYRQYDGYLSGHGAELAEFLSDIKLVNGLGTDSSGVANGAGCLAAQMIAHFKTEPGNIYMVSTNGSDEDIDYVYKVHIDYIPESVPSIGSVVTVEVRGYREKFSGSVEQFVAYCEPEDE